MRHAVLPIVIALGCTAAVFACSSSDDKKDTSDAGGSIGPVGTSSGSSGSSKGDDDDPDAGCMNQGMEFIDCTAQAAHAKDGNCSKYDEKSFKEDCEALNCGTPPSCGDKLKAYGDCLLTGAITCNSDGEVDTTATPTECQAKGTAHLNCLTQQ